MYRHFAIVTVLLTAGVAMFAEGENRQAQATPVVQTAKPAAPVALATTGTQREPGWWDTETDFDNSFVRPMGRLLGGGGNGLIPDLDETLVPGYSPEYLASLSEEERELLLAGLQENGMLVPDIRSRRSAALSAASIRRSGTGSTLD
jgi:hypothetical protein